MSEATESAHQSVVPRFIVRRLRWRFVAVLLIIGAAATAEFAFMRHMAHSAHQIAHLVNVSGRQRMLSQRIALFASLLATGHEAERSRNALRQAIDALEASHQAMMEGSGRLPDPEPEFIALHRSPGGIDAVLKDYLSAAREVADAPLHSLHLAHPKLRRVLFDGPEIVMRRLDEGVQAAEEMAGRAQRTSDTTALLVWLLNVGLLLVVAVFIFRPMLRATGHALRELEEARHQAVDATEAKSQFLAVMSHEIRTPLNGIVGSLALLQRGELNERQSTQLAIAQEASLLLQTLLDDVLDFARLEASCVTLEVVPFDVETQVRSVLRMLENRARDKGLSLELEIDSALPRGREGDPTRLRQLLVNLVGNAVKFTDAGSVRVRVEALPRLGAEALRFCVEDTGPGIPAEKQANLFDRFTQADASVTREFGGSGLGLSICQQLVTLMGGEIGVQSEVGQGACFWFELRLPFMEPDEDDEPISEVLDGDDVERGGLKGKRVLVVDDNPINQFVAAGILEEWGCEVDLAASGAEALSYLEEICPDIILMDERMPGMTGVETTKRIRAQGGILGVVPIIAVTADVLSGHPTRFHEAGMNAFIPKPLDPQEFLNTVERCLQEAAVTFRREAPPAEELPPSCDRESLAALEAALGAERFTVLLTGWVAQARVRLDEIKEAYAAENWDTLRRQAHGFAGSSGSMGAHRLGHFAAAVEDALMSEGRVADAMVHRLMEEAETVISALSDDAAEPRRPAQEYQGAEAAPA